MKIASNKTAIAEWILSQVLPPDRAASTVGDWMEDAAERGNLWFWSCVFRTTASCLWRDIAQSPATIAGVGLSGFVRSLRTPGKYFLLMVALLTLSNNQTDARLRHDWIYTYIIHFTPGQPTGNFDFTWPFQIAFHFFRAKRLFQTPDWIARIIPGRELVGSIAISLAGWTAIAIYAFLWLRVIHFGKMQHPPLNPQLIPVAIAHDMILFAGALWLRRRHGMMNFDQPARFYL